MKKRRVKIGIVGCGTIGLQLAKAIETRLKDKTSLTAICDIDKAKIRNFLSRIKSKPCSCSLAELIKKCDFVIESASKDAAALVAKKTLSAKKDVLVMSVGGLLESSALFELARRNSARLFIPSGALAGLDGLKGASCARIDRVTLTTKKPAKALEGAPYLAENNIDISSIKEPTVIFQGSVRQAVKGFPKNVNVAATLGLVSRGVSPENILIRIMVMPGSGVNIHEIEAEGEFGKLSAKTENVPSPDNPKTSFLAALSAIAALEGALDNVRIGT